MSLFDKFKRLQDLRSDILFSIRGLSLDQIDTLSSSGFSPLLMVVREGDIAFARELIRRGVDPNKGLISPLSLAVQKGDFGIVQLLLSSRDIDVNLKTKEWTPLMYACSEYSSNPSQMSEDIIKSLLRAGASYTSEDIQNCIPVRNYLISSRR